MRYSGEESSDMQRCSAGGASGCGCDPCANSAAEGAGRGGAHGKGGSATGFAHEAHGLAQHVPVHLLEPRGWDEIAGLKIARWPLARPGGGSLIVTDHNGE